MDLKEERREKKRRGGKQRLFPFLHGRGKKKGKKGKTFPLSQRLVVEASRREREEKRRFCNPISTRGRKGIVREKTEGEKKKILTGEGGGRFSSLTTTLVWGKGEGRKRKKRRGLAERKGGGKKKRKLLGWTSYGASWRKGGKAGKGGRGGEEGKRGKLLLLSGRGKEKKGGERNTSFILHSFTYC